MNVNDLRLDIVNNTIKNLYFLTGDEVGIRDIYINKIKDKLNLPVSYINSFSDIKNKLNSGGLLVTKHLYIIVDDKDILQQENLWDLFSTIKYNYVIFVYSNLDKRSKFYKEFNESIVEFEYLDEETLVKYIQKDVPQLTRDNCLKLIKLCNRDYARILLELDKIKIYNTEKYSTDVKLNDAFMEFKSNIYEEPEDAIFEVIEAILKKDVKKAYERLSHSERIGESNINILYNLYNTTKQVLQVQTLKSKDVEKSTGLTSWQIKYAKEKSGYYTSEQLLNILKLVQEVDTKIKKGLITEDISVRFVMAKIFSW